MKAKRSQVGWGFWLQWVLASAVGMFVAHIMGVILVVAIDRVLGESAAAIEFLEVFIGIAIGVLQWLVLRRRVSGAGWWVLASAAGGYGILQATGFFGPWESLESFRALWTGVVALGGAVTGTLQWLVLRGQVSRAGWWVLASTVGWGLSPTVARALSWGVSPEWGAVRALVLTGAVLGAVTGGVLVWLLRQPVLEV